MAALNLPPTQDELARLLPDFRHRHGIRQVELFGSVATGTARPGSDLDLMVTFRPGVEPGLEFFALQEELECEFGCRVDVFTRRSVERSENAIRRKSILESARVVYAG